LQIIDISEFQYGEDAEGSNIDALQMAERVDAIYGNMDLTGEWMRARFITLGNYIDQVEDRLLRNLLPSRDSSRAGKDETSRRLTEMSKNITWNITYGAGCDDLDQDREKGVDNCEEDLYPPGLSFPASLDRNIVCPDNVDLCLKEYFQSQDDAEAFISAALQGIDDCAGPIDIRKDFLRLGECGETKFEVTPVQTFPESSDCYGVELPGKNMTVMVGLDDRGPGVTCGFLPDPSISSISSSADGKTLFIQEASADFVDTTFYFDIEENCPGDVEVEVKVETNEFANNEIMVELLAMRSLGSVEQAIIYVAPQSCARNSASSTICREDPATPFRFYEIQVTAVDKAGNEGTATCRVIVEPDDSNNNRMLLNADVAGSMTRLPVSKLALTWNQALAPSAMPSSAPTISMQPTSSVLPSLLPSLLPSVKPSEEGKKMDRRSKSKDRDTSKRSRSKPNDSD
jgi:hypothetical protein